MIGDNFFATGFDFFVLYSMARIPARRESFLSISNIKPILMYNPIAVTLVTDNLTRFLSNVHLNVRLYPYPFPFLSGPLESPGGVGGASEGTRRD